MGALEILQNLKVGQRKVYMEAQTDWSRLFKNRELVNWCEAAIDSGDYVFTQSLMSRNSFGIGTYLYICKRLK